MASGGDKPQNGGETFYNRNVCVRINVGDNTKVKAKDVIRLVTDCLDVDSIIGVVPKYGDMFEVALKDRECVRILCPEIEVEGKCYTCSEVVQEDVVVSILHLPTYVTDDQICERVEYYGVQVMGEVKRRKYPGTNIVDGTRYVRVKFPPEIKSLPYTIKFFDGENWGYYRVIHNNQVKVCNNCLSDEHVYKFCPENRCYKCTEFGHLAKFCEAEKCSVCKKYGKACVCLCDRCGVGAGQCAHEDEMCPDCGKFDSDCDCSIIVQDNDTLEDCLHCGKCACQCPIVADASSQHVTTASQEPVAHDNIDESDHEQEVINTDHSVSDNLGQRDPDQAKADTDHGVKDNSNQCDPDQASVNTDHGVNVTDQPPGTELLTDVKTPNKVEHVVTKPVPRANSDGTENQVITSAIVHSEPKDVKKSCDTQNVSENTSTKNARKRGSNGKGEQMDTKTTGIETRRKRLDIKPNVSVARAFHKKHKKDDEIEMLGDTDS